MLGTIKNLKQANWFGFITPENGWDDLFFHFSAVEGWVDAFNTLAQGQQVEFDVINWRKPGTKQASNVTLA